jgi:TPR repeat protein
LVREAPMRRLWTTAIRVLSLQLTFPWDQSKRASQRLYPQVANGFVGLCVVILVVTVVVSQAVASETKVVSNCPMKAVEGNAAFAIAQLKSIDGEVDHERYAHALKLFGKSYFLCPKSEHAVGTMYLNGWGVEQDEVKGLEMLKKAAVSGYEDASMDYGLILYSGSNGMAENKPEAIEFFKKASEQGSVYTAFYVAQMYYQGDGVTQDIVKSYMWAKIGVAIGDDNALKAEPTLKLEMTRTQITEAEGLAKDWLGKHK